MIIPLNRSHHAWPKLFWLGCCAVVLCGSLRADEYSITTWGVDEGLPQSSVTDIAQTPDGYLWMGTLLSGVSRFDGVQFVNFDSANTPGLDNSGVQRLFVDAQGNLWVSDNAGNLLRRQGNTFVKAGENLRLDSLVGERLGRIVFAMLDGGLAIGICDTKGQWTWQRHQPPLLGGKYDYHQDRDGVVWFKDPNGKIGRFEDGHFVIMESPPGLASGNIKVLASDAAGQIWVGTDVELARWEKGAFTNLNPGGPNAKISVRHILPVTGGRVWLEVDATLALFDKNHWSPPMPAWDSNRLPWLKIRKWCSDNIGGLWIALYDEGLVHMDQSGNLVRVTIADGLPSQLMQAFFADREGNLWAGYNRGGLIQVRKRTFHTITRHEGLLDTLVTSVTEDSSGGIWFGTASGAVARWAQGVCTNFSLPLRGQSCRDAIVVAGSDGRVWVGTGGNGLLVWERGKFRHALLPEQMPQDDQRNPKGIRQLLVAKNGDVWFANFGGLYRYDGRQLNLEALMKSTDQVVSSLVQGADGAIWFGTIGGMLQLWQNGKLSSYQPTDQVQASRFWALCPESDGTIWIGTLSSGLLRFKDGKFTRFTTADGLANDSISHILADDRGNLWLGSRAGVMCVSKKSLLSHHLFREPVVCRLFGRSDGLSTLAMTLEFEPSCVKTHDGILWFGSPKGANWVDSKTVRASEPAPSVLVESVYVDKREREFSKNDMFLSLPEITVEPGAKNLEVHFSSPMFTTPNLMRFKYRLEKLNADWIDLGGQRSVTFPFLPPGEYTFRVMAENSDGLWSQQPAAFRLVVRPHFWERKLFLVAASLTLLSAVAFTVRQISRQRFRRKLETLRQQQQIEHERARIARDLHDDLGAGLTSVSLTSDLIADSKLPENEIRQYANEVGVRARQLVQRMDEIVWAVNPRHDSVVSLSAYACEYAQLFLDPLNITCRVDVQPILPKITLNAEQRYNFFLAFKEAITNLARHSRATEMSLAIHADNGILVFLIKDNGRGFELDGERAGADGLRNMRERIQRIGGECEIFSQPGQGTSVSLRVPLAANN